MPWLNLGNSDKVESYRWKGYVNLPPVALDQVLHAGLLKERPTVYDSRAPFIAQPHLYHREAEAISQR